MRDGKSEDERHIKQLRDFQKASPSNRRCFDCNEMGPQYVCLDFNTFVCTTCSGIHREFSHRIKSISMSSFSDTEVNNIVKHGGNDAAQKYWLARFDVNSQPSSNLNARDRIRNFIRDAYIDRRWVYEEPKQNKPPVVKKPAPLATDFNPFQLPPPSANQQSSAAFGDFSSFNSKHSSNKTPASSAPSTDFADFGKFNTAETFQADFSQFNSKDAFPSFDKVKSPVKSVEVDIFESSDPFGGPIPITPVKTPAASPVVSSPAIAARDPFAAFVSPSQPTSTPLKKLVSPAVASFPSPPPAPRDPFAAFTSPSQQASNPFGSFGSPPQKPVDLFSDPFSSYTSPQVAPIQPKNYDPFAAYTSPQPKSSYNDPFSSPAPSFNDPFTPPQKQTDPFAACDVNPFTEPSKTVVSGDPFNAFDSLVSSKSEPVAAAALDMWGQPPPASKPATQYSSPVAATTAYPSGMSTMSYSSGNSYQNHMQSAPQTPFDMVSPPLHPGPPNAYGSQPKQAEANPAALLDPFASLDIGIKSTKTSPSPPSTNYNKPQAPSYNPVYSTNQMFPSQPQNGPSKPATAQASSNPFDMF
ncbi:ADP-ribosylation factor GTPase-activating protein AGD14-like [Thraustotheca clavata]|uniref:ADP-ribosylation factor GTPase-activating protein AGD14-like n=1 Tax=Thraustotheca clavata TaxID=74557 RepID=A0A1V9ZWC5_9STRA|nr:ADP-ribosylation factor GTPase-activating protein AGD14-like [Thraustotheca clavata]